MFKTFGYRKSVFVNQDEGMFVALPVTLDSRVLTLETTTEGGRTKVLAGSVVKRGSNVLGILAEEYDITYGPVQGRVVVEGYAWASRLTANALAAASALPKIVVMPYKAAAIRATKMGEGLVVLHLEGGKWSDSVNASHFTFKNSSLTINELYLNDDNDLMLLFTGNGEDLLVSINSAALVDVTGKTFTGLPIEIDLNGSYVLANVGSYNSSTNVWTNGGTSYSVVKYGNTYKIYGVIPYAAADATLGLDAGNRLQLKFKNTDISSRSELPDGNILTSRGKNHVNVYDKNAFETDGTLILVANVFKDFGGELEIEWTEGSTEKYIIDVSSATFAPAN